MTDRIDEAQTDEGRPEPTEDELRAEPSPDPRQAAYGAVYEYIRELGDYMPPTVAHRNAVAWRAVHAALDATHVGRCISSHCVEGDHILDLDPPTRNDGPSVAECAAADRAHWADKYAGEGQ